MENVFKKLKKPGWGLAAVLSASGLSLTTPAPDPVSTEPVSTEPPAQVERVVEETQRNLPSGEVITIRKFESDPTVKESVKEIENAVNTGTDAITNILNNAEERPIHTILTLIFILWAFYSDPPKSKTQQDEKPN